MTLGRLLAQISTPAERLTIGAQLSRHRGVGSGFDFLRLALAGSVLAWHSYVISSGDKTIDFDRSTWIIGFSIVPMFFALSGFLIAASAQRLKLSDFLINRGLRVVPPLAVQAISCAIVLGAIFTTLPLRQYYASWGFFHYFANIVGLTTYRLPGVFEAHPDQYVNGSLWTIRWEVMCYIFIATFMTLGVLRRPVLVLACAGTFVAAGLAIQFTGLDQHVGSMGIAIRKLFLDQGSRLILDFMLGVAAYCYRDRIPYSIELLAVSFIIMALIWIFAPIAWLNLPALAGLTAMPLVYITVFVGVTNIPKIPIYSRGDYSYGIYLYGYPIQQAVKGAFPHLTNATLLTCLSLPFVSLFAMLSWHYIEKPILRLRQKFSFVATTRLDEEPLTRGDRSRLSLPAGPVPDLMRK